jgi:hypothetical protein
MLRIKKNFIASIAFLSPFLFSCYRNDIEFGNLPEGNYTNIVLVDSVEAKLSTVVLDSFSTNNATSFLFGKYKDPFLGIISAKPFFQMTIPSATTISPSAQYDSICFIMHLNKYYYGDTTRQQTITVNELNEVINYTYNNYLFNTSNIPVKPTPLGSRTLRIRPSTDDSVVIRLSDTKGTELFSKLQQQSNEVILDDDFQNYFKGISLSVNNGDTTSVYGIDGTAGRMLMRIYYHTTIPYQENKFVDFTSKANSYSFNQVITDRAGTSLYSSSPGLKEFFSEQTNNIAFSQDKTGVLLKIIFPTLKKIITTDKIVKLQKAELIIRPMGQSYDHLYLPSNVYLAKTDGTNSINSVVLDSTLSVQQIISPVIDNLYGLNTYYRFNVSYYINSILNNSGTEDQGFYLLQDASSLQVNRIVAGNGKQSLFRPQLILTLITINK